MMRPHLYRTPFRRYWEPLVSHACPGLLPDRMDDLTHTELRLVLAAKDELAS